MPKATSKKKLTPKKKPAAKKKTVTRKPVTVFAAAPPPAANTHPELSALHAAARAIRTIVGVTAASAENDSDSGEICFTTVTRANGQIVTREFTLRLEEDTDA